MSNKFDPPIGLGGRRAVLDETRARRCFDNQISNHGHLSIWEGGDPEGPSILLFGDSFADGLVPFIAHRARRLVRLHTSSIDREVFFRERPQVVISISIERFLRSAPAGISDFSYKSNLRAKLETMDDTACQKLRDLMRQPQSPANLAYAADVLTCLPLD